MEWTVVYLNDDVRAEIEILALDLRSKFKRIVELVRSKGLGKFASPISSTSKINCGRCA